MLSSEETAEHHIILIEDNSMGMDNSPNGQNVFELYRTLGDMDDFNGIGLYLTKYQIELLGGRIQLESGMEKGNIFKLYFPKNGNTTL